MAGRGSGIPPNQGSGSGHGSSGAGAGAGRGIFVTPPGPGAGRGANQGFGPGFAPNPIQFGEFTQGMNNAHINPYYLSNSDHPGMQLVSNLFNGTNFTSWSRGVRMALGAKVKLGFITGACVRPDEDSDEFERWIRADYMVTCWLINSMTSEIGENFMHVQSSKELWDEIRERFYESNDPLIYQFRRDIGNLRQENMSVSVYYGKLKRIWDELQLLDPLPVCSCEGISHCSCLILKKILDRDNKAKIMQLLMGLNESLTQFIPFRHMSSLKLKEVLVCPDLDREKVSNLMLEALILMVEDSYGETTYGFKEYPIVKGEHFRTPQPRCVVYFDLSKEDSENVSPSSHLYTRSFRLGGRSFYLSGEYNVEEEHHTFGLYLYLNKGSESCIVDFEFKAMKKSSMEFQNMQKISHSFTDSVGWGFANLFSIPWTDFMSKDSDYFIDGILHLQAGLTITNSEA